MYLKDSKVVFRTESMPDRIRRGEPYLKDIRMLLWLLETSSQPLGYSDSGPDDTSSLTL
jgi:hypothetical protein